MKRTAALFLVLVMILSMLSACSGLSAKEEGNPAETEETEERGISLEGLKTIGDLISLEAEWTETSLYQDMGLLVYGFSKNGGIYQARASFDDAFYQAYEDLDMMDDHYEDDYTALVSPLEITEIIDLTDRIPSQEEMDTVIGKTGEELFEEGWYNSGWNLDTMEFYMVKGLFTCKMVMEGETGDYDEFDEDDLAGLVVKSVSFEGPGDLTLIDFDEK